MATPQPTQLDLDERTAAVALLDAVAAVLTEARLAVDALGYVAGSLIGVCDSAAAHLHHGQAADHLDALAADLYAKAGRLAAGER